MFLTVLPYTTFAISLAENVPKNTIGKYSSKFNPV